MLKLDIIKKGIGITLLVLSMSYGVEGIAISLVATNFIATVINIAPNRRILNYGYMAQLMDIGRNAVLAVFMGIIVYYIGLLPISAFPMLIAQVVLGVGFYIGVSIITKNESYYYALTIIRQAFNK